MPLQRGSQSIHYREIIFQFAQKWSCMKQQRGLFTPLHECVTCLTAVTPSMWFTSLTKTLLDRTVELVKFNPAKLPFPQLCTDTDMHICKHTRMRTCMYATARTQTYLFHFNPTHPLFRNTLSSFHAAAYASWMFASDIQISGAAKCVTQAIVAYSGWMHSPVFCSQRERRADSSETKQSTVINGDIFHVT